jgi:hypothetical protein
MKDTMEGLKSQLFERHYHEGEEPVAHLPEISDPKEVIIQTTFTRQLTDLHLRRAAIDRMVVARNDLVHNLLFKLEPRSLDSCNDVAGLLDRQRQMILPELEFGASRDRRGSGCCASRRCCGSESRPPRLTLGTSN